jgi:membrane-bound serine protease (ClpP class)
MGLGLAILLFFLGILLVVLEIFFPSFGVLSLTAAGAFIGAVVLAFQESTTAGFTFIACTVIALPILLRFGFRVLPKTSIGRRIVLRNPPSRMIERTRTSEAPLLVGKSGRTLSELRPAGTVEIEGRRLDAVTEGEYVEPDREVRVIRHEGNRLVVEEVEGSEARSADRKKPRWA